MTRHLIACFCFLFLITASATAATRYEVLFAPDSGQPGALAVSIAEGEVATLTCVGDANFGVNVTVLPDTTSERTWRAFFREMGQQIVVPGPAHFAVGQLNVSPTNVAVTVEVRSADGGYTSNALALPQVQDGLYNVEMQASTDLVRWETVIPGEYLASSPQRYFRLRATRMDQTP
jgi:hypothetical protein